MDIIIKKTSTKKLISVIACLAIQLCVGIIYLWSVFNKHTQDEFLLSEGLANYVSAIMIFGFVLGNLIGGYIQDKTNPKLTATIGCILFSLGILSSSFLTQSTAKLIFLTYSITAGVGSGFAYASVLSCLQKWFPERRGFASGLSVASFSASTVIFSPVSSALLDSFTVAQVFRILATIFFVVSMLACFFMKLPDVAVESISQINSANQVGSVSKIDSASQVGSVSKIDSVNQPNSVNQSDSVNQVGSVSQSVNQPNSASQVANISNQKTGKTPIEALKTAGFWCIFFTSFFINATWGILVNVIKPLGEARGLSATVATAVVMLAGITNATGRLGMASLSDKFKRTSIMIAMAGITVTCALMLVWAQSWLFLVVVLFTALSYGGPSAIMPAMSVDLFGTKYSGTNYGLILLSLGFSTITFTTISNALKSYSGNYMLSFIMVAICAVIPIALMLVYARLYNKPSGKLVGKSNGGASVELDVESNTNPK